MNFIERYSIAPHLLKENDELRIRVKELEHQRDELIRTIPDSLTQNFKDIISSLTPSASPLTISEAFPELVLSSKEELANKKLLAEMMERNKTSFRSSSEIMDEAYKKARENYTNRQAEGLEPSPVEVESKFSSSYLERLDRLADEKLGVTTNE